MKNALMVAFLFLLGGCASVSRDIGAATKSWHTGQARENTAQLKEIANQLDVELMMARNRARHRTITPEAAQGEQALVRGITEPITASGYDNSFPVIVLNHTRYALIVRVTDPRGKVFSFQLPRADFRESAIGQLSEQELISSYHVIHLEIGSHFAEAYRLDWGSHRWRWGRFIVRSEPTFFPDPLLGVGSSRGFYGYVSFTDS